MEKVIICNFSAGITSTVATKLTLDKYGKDKVRIVFFETGQHHPDNVRFIKECEQWFGKHIEIFQNTKYKNPIEVGKKIKYINGPAGASCTLNLKKNIRIALENWIDYESQIFGFEYNKKEMNRALRFIEQYPEAKAIFPLIEEKLTKQDCFDIIEKAGIEIPTMYKLGYHNNNCMGCWKGGKGYWNKIREDFPEIFEETSKMEREVGRSCINGTFLDELVKGSGRHKDFSFECGAFCQVEMKGLKVYDDLEELRDKILLTQNN